MRPTPSFSILRLRSAVAGLLLVLALPALSNPPQEPWPTTRFDVCGAPAPLLGANTDAACAAGDPNVKAEIARHLSAVAQHYERQGWKAPQLEPIVDTRAGPAYRVFLWDYDDSEGHVYYENPCALISRPVIRIDADRPKPPNATQAPRRVVNGGKVMTMGYHDLAHELFHAVTSSYRIAEDCYIGVWIYEGTAEAVARYAIEALAGMMPPDPAEEIMQDFWRRSYARPLRVAALDDGGSKEDGYDTAGLWRFLGEEFAANKKKTSAGNTYQVPDYRYLQELFDKPLVLEPVAKDERETKELSVVGDGLHGIFKRRLGDLYPAFVTTWADYDPNRIPKALHGKWQDGAFGDCNPVAIRLRGVSKQYYLEFKRVATRCLKVTTPVKGKMSVTVLATHKDSDALKDLVVGVPGGPYGRDPSITALPGDNGFFADWTFKIDTTKSRTLLISHVAPVAENTAESLLAGIQLGVGNWSVKQISPGPSRQAARSVPELKTPAAGTDSAAGELTSMHSLASSIRRLPDDPACDSAFQFLACGPQTKIMLTWVPQDAVDLSATAGRGAFGAQITAHLSGNEGGGMQAYADALEKKDVQRIDIALPLIDYGFAGSFENASIVAMLGDGRALQAVGPADVQPGAGTMFPLRGNVTIESFSPFYVHGTFSANLVNPADMPPVDNPVLGVVRTLEGQFTVVNTARFDKRLVGVASPVAPANVQMAEAFPGILTTTGDISDSPADDDGPAGGGNGSQGGVDLGGCNCSCNFRETATPQCRLQCEPVFAACEASYFPPLEPSPNDGDPAIENNVDEMRARYRERLIEQGYEGPALQMFLDMFDQADAPTRRIMLGGDEALREEFDIPPP